MIPLNEISEVRLNSKNEAKYSYNGKEVARVTHIISKMIHEDSLIQWANGLGFRRVSYRQVLKEASVYGTYTHQGIESFLKNEPVPDVTPPISMEAFKKWWNKVNDGNKVSILGQEVSLTCEYFGGTYDMLLKINDVIYLVDFKTSNHVTYRYYLQLAAYNYLLKQQGITIGGVIILQLNKTQPEYTEYILDLSNPVHNHYFQICERTFLSLVYAYYHITWLEEGFNNELHPRQNNT